MTHSLPVPPCARPRPDTPRALLALGLAVALLAAACGESREARLEDIRMRIEAGQSAEALEDLRAILDEDPDDPQANFLLGAALSASRQYSRAMIPLQKALEAEEYRRHAAVMLTAAFLNTSNLEGALDVADRLVELDPEEPAGWHLRTRANLALNRREQALEDATRLVELAPDDAAAIELRAAVLLGLGRLDEATNALADAEARAAAQGDRTTAARTCALRALAPTQYGGGEGEGLVPPEELDDAELQRCLADYPTDPALLSDAAGFYARRGDMAQAVAIFRSAVELAPEVLRFRVALANQLWMDGRRDEAFATLQQAVDDFANAQAWLSLAELHRLDGDLDAAVESAGRAAEVAPDAMLVQYRHAELLAEAGRLDEAKEVAAALGDPIRGRILEGQILLQQGRPDEALDALEEGLAQWPDNAQARALAGQAAQQLLDVDKALGHYRESVRSDPAVSNAGLLAARLYHARGEHAAALRVLAEYGRTHPQDIGAFRLGVRIAQAMESPKELEDVLSLMEKGTDAAKAAAVAERTRIRFEAEGPEAATAYAREHCELTTERCQVVVEELAILWQEVGRPAQALALVDRALAARPDAPELQNVRGRLLLHLGRDAEAGEAFERALAADPDFGPAVAGLGAVALRQGEADRAVDLFDRAVSLREGDTDSALRAAQILLASGRTEEAERRLRDLLGRDPSNAEAANDLAWILAEEKRDLELAERLAQQAAESTGARPTYLDTLAWVQIRRGEPAEAVATLQRALAQAPADPTLRYRMALAQLALDEPEAARSSLEQALSAGTFPEADEARAALARLDDAETR